MREAVIVSGVRTAVGKAPRGALKDYRPEELLAVVLNELVARTPGITPGDVEDVIIGNAMVENEHNNIGRVATMRAGFPNTVPATVVSRMCSSGLQSIADACQKIMAGMADVVIAGGVESMSLIGFNGSNMPNPYLVEHYPQACMSMGLTAEEVALRYGVGPEAQAAFAVSSNQKAIRAIREGRFEKQIVPVNIVHKSVDPDGNLILKEQLFAVDEGPREGVTVESLLNLRPVFKKNGRVTAGTSSQTSDGAAAVMVMSREKAVSMGLKPMLIFRSFSVIGCNPEEMGIGPSIAIPKALQLANVSVKEIDVFEINEAFASQAIYCMEKLELDTEKVNPNGGAIALGHPLGCTGSKLTVQLANELDRQNKRYGVISMCIGLGMGAAAVFERPV